MGMICLASIFPSSGSMIQRSLALISMVDVSPMMCDFPSSQYIFQRFLNSLIFELQISGFFVQELSFRSISVHFES